MKVVLITGNITDRLYRAIQEINPVSIDAEIRYHTFNEAYAEMSKLHTKADVLIVTDEIFGDDYMDTSNKLADLLRSRTICKIDRVLHLASTGSKLAESVEFIMSDIVPYTVVRDDGYTVNKIVDIISSELDSKEISKANEDKFIQIIRYDKNSKDKIMMKENTQNRTVIISTTESQKIIAKQEIAEMLKDSKGNDLISMGQHKVPKTLVDGIELEQPFKVSNPPPGKKISNKNIYLVTGERSSGKTVFSVALALSMANNNDRGLIVDLTQTMGLSIISDTFADSVNFVAINDYKNRMLQFKDKLKTSKKITIIGKNYETYLNENDDRVDSVIIYLLKDIVDQYDYVIIDLPLTKLNKCMTLNDKIRTCIITTSLYKTNVYSLINLLKSIPLDMFHNIKNHILIPTAVYSTMNLPKYNRSTCVNYLKDFINVDYKSTAEIRINSFNKIDDTIATAIKELSKEW